jgi:hypothetical protein
MKGMPLRLFLLAAALLLPSEAYAQKVSDKLPPANALAYADDDTGAVMAPITALFAAFERGDGAGVLANVYPEGRVTAVGTLPGGAGGVRKFSFAEFAAHLKPEGAFQERITDPAIDVDGDIAMVWAPSTVRVGGRLESCGFDHFDLVRENGAWKVMNVTFSSRTTGCAAQ